MFDPRIVFFGNTKFSVIGAELINDKFPFKMVVTTTDKPTGRDKKLTPSPVKEWAKSNNIGLLETDKITRENIEEIAKVETDFLVVEDYGLILSKDLLKLPKFAPLNIHHSLLPKYRGPAPAPYAILAGEKISGVSIIKMTETVDAGDIYAQRKYVLSPAETTESLLTELNKLGGQLLIEVVERFLESQEKGVPQDELKSTITKKFTKEDAYFEINNPPSTEVLDRMIRAYYPWPSVWTKWEGKIVKFLPRLQIQMEGKKPTDLKSFLNGYPDFPIKEI